ncbi:MAG: bifunctional fucokinase/L-fucose-1-P-guanylyltransferase [Prevotella sp.]|nr:bifunctional fucokinase/L-fucose-1-P-guanylyltransferase [Prevotella sp.]MBR3480611.1 bifunctional fucokinase/L-fucose-1-P-guanylyltransferase [Prevotella sp.]
MKKLLSLPPNLVRKTSDGKTIFHEITGLSQDDYFCTCDPEGHRVGSGGGTVWLLWQAFLNVLPSSSEEGAFYNWLASEKRILLHAGGQSRRLPSYAPSGKILTPVPVFRWERGQRLSQDLLSLQLPLYEQIMEMAPECLHTMVVSGDVLIRVGGDQRQVSLPPVPNADVVCYGMWLDASIAKDHGVFLADRRTPHVLKQMLQKPSVERLQELQRQHYFLTDIGVWLLSDKAVEMLFRHCIGDKGEMVNDKSSVISHLLKPYDLYSEFGCALGTNPTIDDSELRELTVVIVPLNDGEFYHFGTSREMISSTVALQNVVSDQRQIMHHDRKPHPSIFVQNAITEIAFTSDNTNIWIENSHIGPKWTLTRDNIITGVPRNDWEVHLAPGECLDVVPIGEDDYAIRRYHIDDRFDGAEQQKEQFPLTLQPQKLSAEQLSSQANLTRLFAQREQFRCAALPAMAKNWEHSVFYQLDLDDVSRIFHERDIPLPPSLPADAPLMTRIHDAMFRGDSTTAFGLLREGLTAEIVNSKSVNRKSLPRLSVHRDQIVWSRSPVRIDIAGGWTDTPPYCLLEGGNVVNLAIELNGQQPLQAYVKPSAEPRIILRSIDLGAAEVVTTFDELRQFNRVGSPFSIPKAALALAGFLPEFCEEQYPSLEAQLNDFGCGLELTLLSAIPAGSGLGTSSILAATVLAAISDSCSLNWDKNELGRRTLVLEQLLTTGGGWQDQFGGLLGGVKLLQTPSGFTQDPVVRWLPTDIYTAPEYRSCHLLYYTGITRTAKQILAEIVRRMFLNHHDQLLLLRQMGRQAIDMYEAIQRQDFQQMGLLVRKTWQQNQQLDSGTNPDGVRRLTDLIDDLCLGYKLPGAGGGGYLYMVAKDPEAAARIRRILNDNSINANARFVDMALSPTGLQLSRS